MQAGSRQLVLSPDLSLQNLCSRPIIILHLNFLPHITDLLRRGKCLRKTNVAELMENPGSERAGAGVCASWARARARVCERAGWVGDGIGILFPRIGFVQEKVEEVAVVGIQAARCVP